MATTVQTILRSAKSRGAFVGVTLKTRRPDVVLEGTVKVASISPNYVTLNEYNRFGLCGVAKVRNTTIRQVRVDGIARNTRAR